MISSRGLICLICLFVILSAIIVENGEHLVVASGKKKFLKGFILGALLAKGHHPVIYSMPSGHGGHSGGYY